MLRSAFPLFLATAALGTGACGKKDDPAKKAVDAKADPAKGAKDDAKAEGGEPSLQVADGEANDPGPVPPETSMVFFTVEGALMPLACFDKDKGALAPGADCLGLVAAGQEARVSSGDTSAVFEIGEPAEPLCTAGDGKKTALAADGIGEGANYVWAAWPRSAFKTVQPVAVASVKAQGEPLAEAEQTALGAAVERAGGRLDGDLLAHQIVEVPVTKDRTDRFFSVFVRDPKVSERYAFSALFAAVGGNLDELVVVEKSRSKQDVFEVRGSTDLDGNGTRELWLRMVFEEGAGDRIVEFDGKDAKPIGRWSCGA